MKHSIKIIFGQEQVNKFYCNEPFTSEEKQTNIKEYSFGSKEQLDAFCLGINESVGWTECHIVAVASPLKA